MAKLRSCGFLIYRNHPGSTTGNKKSFLLMKHRNRWDLPKGHVDKGESDMECAIRELHEETGISEHAIRVDQTFRFKEKYKVRYKRFGNEPVKKKLIIFLAELIQDIEIELTEHIGFEWIEWSPPHQIQEKTIDPLLAEVAAHWKTPISETVAQPTDRSSI